MERGEWRAGWVDCGAAVGGGVSGLLWFWDLVGAGWVFGSVVVEGGDEPWWWRIGEEWVEEGGGSGGVVVVERWWRWWLEGYGRWLYDSIWDSGYPKVVVICYI